MKVSRRSVLKGGAALAAAGVGSSILGPNIAHAQSTPRNSQSMSSFAVPARRASPPQFALAELGMSVIVIEAQSRFGGRGIVNSGNIPIGGGSPAQILAGIADTPDKLFSGSYRLDHRPGERLSELPL